LQNRQSAINAKLALLAVEEHHSGDDLVEAFARWAAGERASTAAQERARERWLRAQATSEATWTGVVLDLAEQRAVVTVAVASQRRSGRIVGVGRDFCVLHQANGRPAVVPLHALSAVLPDAGTAAVAANGRRPDLEMMAIDAFEALAGDRAPVALVVNGGQQFDGDLLAMGEDVLTLQTGPPARRLIYVPLAAVLLCELH
jgi:hypothetical protein